MESDAHVHTAVTHPDVNANFMRSRLADTIRSAGNLLLDNSH